MEKQTNHYRYWAFIPLALLFGKIFDSTVDIQMHDTYFVTSRFHLCILLSILLFISGLGYFIFRKLKMNSMLMKMHNWITLLGVIIILASSSIHYFVDQKNVTGGIMEYGNKQDIVVLASTTFLGLILIFIGFVAYLLNITFSSFQYFRSRT